MIGKFISFLLCFQQQPSTFNISISFQPALGLTGVAKHYWNVWMTTMYWRDSAKIRHKIRYTLYSIPLLCSYLILCGIYVNEKVKLVSLLELQIIKIQHWPQRKTKFVPSFIVIAEADLKCVPGILSNHNYMTEKQIIKYEY